MQIKSENPKLKQSEIAKKLGCSSSTLQRYRNDFYLFSTNRVQPNFTNNRSKKVSNTNLINNSHRRHDIKRPQMTSNDLRTTSNEPANYE